MKHIRDYKLFESKEFDDIETDIEGILVELKDKGYYFTVHKGVVDRKISKVNTYSSILNINDKVDGIVIKIRNTDFKGDIEDYILTVIDYIKIQFDISEIIIYDSNNRNWWNMSTQFHTRLGLDRWDWFKLKNYQGITDFVISIRKK